MGIVEEIAASVKEDRAIERIAVGAFDCAVKSAGVGLASTFRDPCGPGRGGPPRGVEGAGGLLGTSALGLASRSSSTSLLEASLGMAALNSLIEPGPESIEEVNALAVIAERGAGKRVAVVGHFPFIRRLAPLCDLSVIQREPWEREAAIREAERTLPGCEVVGLTASSLINHTFDRLLELSRGAFVVVIGPSTPLSPVLFDHGADILCGTIVEDEDLAFRCIEQGANYRQIKGVRRVALVKG